MKLEHSSEVKASRMAANSGHYTIQTLRDPLALLSDDLTNNLGAGLWAQVSDLEFSPLLASQCRLTVVSPGRQFGEGGFQPERARKREILHSLNYNGFPGQLPSPCAYQFAGSLGSSEN